jgi:hypothetical protein
MEESMFWIIFNPDYPAPPTVQFKTRKAAEASARLMAFTYHPHRFYVCKAESVARTGPVTLEKLKK